MKRILDPRGFLLATGIALGVSLAAFPILYLNIGPTSVLHSLIYFPLCIASGVLYVWCSVKRRSDLSISQLGLGGALTAILPACVLTLSVSSFGTVIIDGRATLNLAVFVLMPVFAGVGAILGCVGAIISAMREEAKFLRSQRSDRPRPLPRSGERRL